MPISTIKSFHKNILQGNLSFEQNIAQHLQNIKNNASTNAFVEVFEEEALQVARGLDVQLSQGKLLLKRLTGVAVSIKDNICYKGHTSSAASKILAGYKSPYSATAVEKLLAEGAIIIGTTNCDQFGMGSTSQNSYYGAVKNGHDQSLIAGGSSGGAAVSVQIGGCKIALGSDTGGSIRQPAAFTGTIGFKPTYGAISRHGLIAYGSSFDQIGIIGYHYDDLKTTFDVIRGKDAYDSTSIDVLDCSQSGDSVKKLAYIPSMFEGDGEWAEENRAALKKIESTGHLLQPFDFDLMPYLVPTYYILSTAEASSNLSRFDGVRYGHRAENPKDLQDLYVRSRSEGFGSEVKKRIMMGTFVLSEGYFDAYFTKAQKIRQLLRNRILEILQNNDGLVMPISANGPWRLDEKITDPTQIYLSDVYTVLANLVGLPAVTVPLFPTSNSSKPVCSLQIIGKPKLDFQLFNFETFNRV